MENLAVNGLCENVGHPYGKSVTVAYLILAHANPEQLARLVSRLPASSPVLIHFDRRADPAAYAKSRQLLGDRPKLQFVKRHVCRWGAFGIVAGTISLIEALTAESADFDYATLLSGSDYPIKSNREVSAYLASNTSSEFIESFSLTEPNRWSGHGGYFKTPEKVLCRHFRFRSHVLRIPGLRTMPYGMLPYGGSQWWTLTKEAITYVANFVRRAPEFVSFSKWSYIPDESFIQSIISNSYLANRVTGNDLRFVVWDRPRPPYPAILTMRDLDQLLASDKLFARKVDANVDRNLLDALDRRNAHAEETLSS